MFDEDTNVIAHFGIKGMKWGIRRKDPSGSGNKGKTSKTTKAKSLSDEELRKAVKRMELEKKYKTLSAEQSEANKTKTQKAASFVKQTVANSTKHAVQQQSNKILTQSLDLAIKGATTAGKNKK